MPLDRRHVRPEGSLQFQRFTGQQTDRLFAACLEILERTGVQMHDEEALSLLKRAGARISDGNHVRIPPKLVENALSTAPRGVTLYNRHGEPVMPVEEYSTFYGLGSDCLNIIDHRDNERRKPVLQDMVDAITLADALPNVDFVMALFAPLELPQEISDRYQMEVMLNYTTKPIIYVTSEFSGCVDAVEMAEAVVGGENAMREKPLAACYINVTTGLVHNQEALQKLLYLSKKGLPAAYVPSTQGGATAPVTPAAALAVSQAGALAGLVLSQLQREGAPIIMPGWGGNMLDMRSTIQPYADPDKRALAPNFVHALGLPMFALAGVSDAKVVGMQSGIEAALTLLTDALCGANIIHDMGYLESGLCGSLVQLTVCDEILNWIEHFTRPVEVSDETLALDLIDEVGPGGQFLDSEHTLKHYRERWYPKLFDRNNYGRWLEKGGKTLQERAAERVTSILKSHKPEHLSEEVRQAVHAVIERRAADL